MYDNVIFQLGEYANEAMIYEVSSFPAFGLVSPISRGSHTDMDFYTFIDSASTLNKYFLQMANIGYSNKALKDKFVEIRKIGIKAEEAMLKKTNNINTHKGMIFVLGLAISATSHSLYYNLPFMNISNIIKKMTKGVVKNDLKLLNQKPLKNLTHGEQIFLKYNIAGVRWEAEDGFSFIFDYALNLYDNFPYKDQNQRLTNTLLGIISLCQDTTILYRHDYSTLLKLQKKAKNIMDLGGINEPKNKIPIEKLNKFNENKNISPGGSADLLALTVFLSKIKKNYKNFSCNY